MASCTLSCARAVVIPLPAVAGCDRAMAPPECAVAPAPYADGCALVPLHCTVVSLPVGLGALPWLIMGEVFPRTVRASAASLATMANWTFSFAVTLVFSTASTMLGPATVFLFFAAVCACGVVFVLLAVPETKGVPLEQIQALFTPPASQRRAPRSGSLL